MKFIIILFFTVFGLIGIPSIANAEELQTIKLIPTFDTFVETDFNNSGVSLTQNGHLLYMKNYYNNSNQDQQISITYMQFDLKDIGDKSIKNSYLNLKPINSIIDNSTKIVLVMVPRSDWNEITVNYDKRPRFDENIFLTFDLTPEEKWLKWDITEYVKLYQGYELSIAFTFMNLYENTNESISFHSKEALDPDNAPFLEIEYSDILEFIPSKKIIPIADTFVRDNLNDPENIRNFGQLNYGNEEHIVISYSWEAESDEYFVQPINMMFDLSGLAKNFLKAELKMNVLESNLENDSTIVGVFSLAHDNWNESEINFFNKPGSTDEPQNKIRITKDNGWYSWDITEFTRDKIGFNLPLEIKFENYTKGQTEHVVFYSKESREQDKIPYLEITYSSFDSDIITFLPTDDAFVVVNLTDPGDIEGYQTANTGDLDFLKSWYISNVPGHQEQIISNTYLKFDLSDIESDKIINANLKLVPKILTTPFEVPPSLELSKVTTNDWNESEINFTNKPSHDAENFIANTIISDKELVLYNWDITDYVKQNSGSELSVVYSNSKIHDNAEEVISFHSKETEDQNNAPILEIEYILDDAETNTDDSTEGGGCLIATATYGTELAPQVQLLRELRDNTLLQTESGQSFMTAFNDVYYSFSPIIADYERENPLFKETVKLAITPLITSLSILNYVDIDSESEMISYGIGIILLNIGMYGMIPAILVYTARKL